jgi:hypothetical protein
VEQELTRLLELAGQHFGAQIVDYMSVIASEVLDERGGVGSALQAQRCEVKARRPTFGAVAKSRDRVMVEPKAKQVVEQQVRFLI